ncbi:hypothetical protein U7230_14365 [Carboxydochorda subterranea]|uniref:Uncharacterized protein n=1 Tax=Carboxydichorda subterranea TaxID=3109565 RepID=A0ABZ1BWR7_9FIRM|nr:hypothetical protein [Limnochorda sp. L945t]WRP17245.1 hypothetical protein U7230_14365 [Limnochorda sp. L945t]
MATAKSKPRPRFSWWGLLVSQLAVVLGTELVVWWDVGLFWTIGCMSYAAGYAMFNFHPPYREPARHLAITYGVWLAGMVADKLIPFHLVPPGP